MKTLTALLLLLPLPALATDLTVLWDANPPAEQVTEYRVSTDGTQAWAGPETEATVTLEPGLHEIAVRACSAFTNPDNSVATICSDAARLIDVPIPDAPTGVKVQLTITLQ